jgi:hypothetical protein
MGGRGGNTIIVMLRKRPAHNSLMAERPAVAIALEQINELYSNSAIARILEGIRHLFRCFLFWSSSAVPDN